MNITFFLLNRFCKINILIKIILKIAVIVLYEFFNLKKCLLIFFIIKYQIISLYIDIVVY